MRQGAVHAKWQAAIDGEIERCRSSNDPVKVLILAPFGHGKTENVIIGRTLQFLGENTNYRIKILCSTPELSVARVQVISQYIVADSDYHDVYPHVVPAQLGDWSKHKIVVQRNTRSKDGSVEAYGVMSSALGGRCDILLCDDVVDLRNAILAPKLRGSVKEAFRNVWLSRLDPPGVIVYIATVWHTDDLTSELVASREYRTLIMRVAEEMDCLEVEERAPHEEVWCKSRLPLWEEKYTKTVLMDRRRNMGLTAYSRGFRNIALSDEDKTFPHFPSCCNPTLAPVEIVDPGWPHFIGMDPFGKKIVIFKHARTPEGYRVPVDIRVGKWTSSEAITELISMMTDNVLVGMVENNAAQQAIVDWARERKHGYLPIKEFMTGFQKAHPDQGLPSLDVECEMGKWIIPTKQLQEHEHDCKCGWCSWLREAMVHPVGEAEDTIMAWWFSREADAYAARVFADEEPVSELITAQDVGLERKVIGGDY